MAPITGFSKLSKIEKINWIAQRYTDNPEASKKLLQQYWNPDNELQQLHDEFIENTISNYYMPLGIAPNFLINGSLYAIPMAIEESSVVAAASKAAKFWMDRGGFSTEVLDTEKIGQVHFMYKGSPSDLHAFFEVLKPELINGVKPLTQNMEKRGGGIRDIQLRDKTKEIPGYYQLHCSFDTQSAMGANFINSCLEQFGQLLREQAKNSAVLPKAARDIEVVMCILSNYVPNCRVRASVSCPVSDLKIAKNIPPEDFARKFVQAVRMAEVEPYRAVTHNKGIMNGVDAVVLATGNDFRAVEAGVHAYASRNGQYSSLSHAEIMGDKFHFELELPLALGTVGGLTSLHPMVKLALEILQKPDAPQLMQLVAAAGLAQNFAAVSSLVTTGIQRGHMKMHLMNILNQLGATDAEKVTLSQHFNDRTVTNSAVGQALDSLRQQS